MATNLRVLSINAVSNILIRVTFSDNLSPNISTNNLTITSQTPGVPSPVALKTRVIDKVLEITTQPLTSFAGYYIVFQSTAETIFKSLNGTAILFEDGVANKQFFLGPIESSNVVKEYFLNYLRQNVYNLEEGTVLVNYLNVLAAVLSQSLYDVRQAKNDNYLSVVITDERKVRAPTAFDRLNEEGAYEIIRVGKTPTDAVSEKIISIDEFTTDPISLLQSELNESLTVSSIDSKKTFNINTLVLNLSKRFVIKLKSVIFTYTNGHLPYSYDISKFGYQILDQKYDTSVAFKYLQLTDNQIKLSDKILEDSSFSSDSIFQIQVSYSYKDTGRSIDNSTIAVESVLESGREVLPPLRNIFNLKHGPIVSTNNRIGSIGDIKFVNQNALSILDTAHPAFVKELIFRLDFLPSSPGEYSVDYATGAVYVFGSDYSNDGTGSTPPLAIYKYRQNYKEDIDWIVDPDSEDLVALSTGNLIGIEADISFNFEQVLAQDIDYKAQIHIEVLDERINNKLDALNVLSVQHTPITNVFRLFNETSGEIYNVIRWNDNKIFFSYNNPPNIEEISGERVSFESISNEVMFVNEAIDTTNPAIKIFKIVLNNNNLIAQSEDCIGAFFNSSVSFSNTDIFSKEFYFDTLETENINLTRLSVIGYYLVDYTNGIVYVAVSSSQDYNIGAVSYKRGYIKVVNQHITSVEDIYYRINNLSAKEKRFNYTEFDDGFVLPATFDRSDEQLLSGDKNSPYILSSKLIGAFVDTVFVNAVTDDIESIRGIYENDDLLNNYAPINFASSATFVGKSITVDPLEFKEYHSVAFDGSNYYILLNSALHYLSPNITLDISILRLTDNQQLWDGAGVIVLGDTIKLVLSGTNSPQVGDSVFVDYAYTINDISHVIVDYSKGQYYIDYSALTDEIIVSYEYGNNSLDFRESDAVNAGEIYYVSYKVGALRDALLKNFGSLIDIEILNSFDVNFSRERYRDAITAAMHSFSKGPTVAAIENIAKTISHLPATVNESIFEAWSLGNSLLSPEPFKTSGNLQLQQTHYDNGILIDQPDQTITLPAISNLKLDEGTMEMWLKPNWNGLDNLAELKVTPRKDGYLMSELDIFIGALEYHPTYSIDNKGNYYFTLDKDQSVDGTPNKNKDGVYFYYDNDITGNFKRWFVEIIDGYATDGYVNKQYSISISTDGKFYDLKSTSNPKPSYSRITSGTNNVVFTLGSTFINDGITFVADTPHYIFDYGKEENKNRFSIFKDESGYLNFKIFDKLGYSYVVSADISDWRASDAHHVATSWKLNTIMGRDELHLFIDGFEVPNIIRYGDRINPYLHEKVRTVNPEEIAGAIDKNIISGNDLSTIFDSNQVISSINFSQYGIQINDNLYINEVGFDPSGYKIINVNGNTLTIDTSMPFTISNGSFTINKVSFTVSSEIDVYPNFSVSLIHTYFEANDLLTTQGSNIVFSTSTDFINTEVEIGDLIRINDGYFDKHYIILNVSTNALTLNGSMPVSASNLSFNLYKNEYDEVPGLRALHPAYQLSKSTDGYHSNIITIVDKALADDLVFIRTLGINHRRIRRKYYVWGNQSNVLKTLLPSPISLDEVKFTKVILSPVAIGASNATLSGGIYYSNNISADRTSNNANGRTLLVSIKGDNVDYSVPVSVDINGTVVDGYGFSSVATETLVFDSSSSQITSHYFAQINYITVNCKPVNTAISSAIIEIKEQYPITYPENIPVGTPDAPPTVRYSYQVGAGNTLYSDGYEFGDGYVVIDDNKFFSDSLVNNYLLISYPSSSAGFYKITAVNDHKSLTVLPVAAMSPFSAFTDGYYQILKPTYFNSGLQNGYFIFEHSKLPGQPYYLTQGSYELDYYTYLQAPFDMLNQPMYIGSDFNESHQFNGSIDEFKILNIKLTDTRIGETAPKSQLTITKDFNTVKASKPNINTLVLTHFDVLPPKNEASVYRVGDNNILQSNVVINDNFSQSIDFTKKPLTVENNGILNTKKEATIEFWINPVFDTSNDLNYRYYFDAFGAVTEKVVSTNSTTVQISGTASEILDVKSPSGGEDLNYFAGGSLVNGKILLLHNNLPNQNTSVLVTYIPKGLKGDRISLFKDPSGFMNFNIHANDIDNIIRAPLEWARNTWHRVKISYKINGGLSRDEMHMFIDGYEYGNFIYDSGFGYGQGLNYGAASIGPNNLKYDIRFRDPINQFTIGGDYKFKSLSNCLMDNFRISNISRPLYQPFGEPIDPNYSSNIDMVFPINEDLYTTLLLNFDTSVVKNTDFSVLNDPNASGSAFSVNILDSLDIIDNNEKIKAVLETLINSFKPANTIGIINYM